MEESEHIVDILSNINSKGTTIMLVTHDPKIAAKSERVLFMHDGVIVKELMLGKSSSSSFDVSLKIDEAMKSLGV